METTGLDVTELTNWAIDLRDVRKTYGRKIHALRGVDVRVGRGEIFGLLGPNGAGKSTLVKIMMTVVRPDNAVGTVLGRPLGNKAKLGRIGYLPESHRFPGYLDGQTLLDHYAALAKAPRRERRRRAGELLQRVGMSEWGRTKISKYSKGMMQRLGLAQALMNDPELLVLDEPTDGVDPLGRRDIRNLLIELKKKGKTIFLNSHLLSELEMVCDRVAILMSGLVARQGTLSELTEHTLEYRITVVGDCSSLRGEIERLGGVLRGGMIALSGQSAHDVNPIIDLLRARGILIESVIPHRFSLEDIFLETVSKEDAAPKPQPVGK